MYYQRDVIKDILLQFHEHVFFWRKVFIAKFIGQEKDEKFAVFYYILKYRRSNVNQIIRPSTVQQVHVLKILF